MPDFPVRDTPDGRDARIIQFPGGNVKLLPREDGRKIFEVSTTGFDENLQLVGSDPFGGSSWTGLRVPTLPTPDTNHRYLMMLASFSLGERAKARIVGYRQLVKIGLKQAGAPGAASYIEELLVEDPTWHFQDGDVSFHLQQLGPPNNQGFAPPDKGPFDVRNFKFRWCETPAVLYQTATLIDPFYVNLTAYKPPNLGRPWGRPLRNGQQGTFVDLRTQWQTHGAWHSLNVPLDGPDTIALFASVRQTNPSTRPTLTLPGTVFQRGFAREELFLQNFPTAIYWRVAGSLIVELG